MSEGEKMEKRKREKGKEGGERGSGEQERENLIFRYSIEIYSDCVKFRTLNIQNTNSSKAKK
jgi:hypothetical protein